MNTRRSTELAHLPLVDDDFADEISSIRTITALDLELGVTIDAFAFDRRFDDPTPVYARPYSIVAGERNHFAREYFLGTRFETGVIEAPAWEDEMRADGASDLVIAKCRRYLRDNAI